MFPVSLLSVEATALAGSSGGESLMGTLPHCGEVHDGKIQCRAPAKVTAVKRRGKKKKNVGKLVLLLSVASKSVGVFFFFSCDIEGLA